MFNSKAIETTQIASSRVVIGNCIKTGATVDMVYLIHAEVFEATTETGMPWVKDIAPGVYYSFIGAQFSNDEKLGSSTNGMFATVADAKQFAANWVNEAREAFEAAAA